MSAPFMQLYVADYLGDTRHLTTEQHGAYLLLLMTMWRSEGVLSDDPVKLARIAGLTVAKWKRISDDILAFFTPCEGGYTQARLAAELTIADEKSEKRSQSGKAGARAKALKANKAASANAARSLKHSPEPEPEKKEEAKASLSPRATEKAKSSYPEAFEAAWSAYPHVKGRSSKPDTLGQWKAMSPADREALAAACDRYRREGKEPRMDCGAPAMERWLKRGLHIHWTGQDAPAAANGPVDPAVTARRLRHWRDTGSWDAAWGPKPDAANDSPAPAQRGAAA
jgi:uncharacterized protein YdaU (DUF1376 family)